MRMVFHHNIFVAMGESIIGDAVFSGAGIGDAVFGYRVMGRGERRNSATDAYPQSLLSRKGVQL